MKKRVRLSFYGKSEASVLKREIQALLRAVVIKRDKGCILRKLRRCGDSVLQADHLITRANSATYADSRLVVCVCRPCHFWKKFHKEEYDALVKTILSKERVELWERCEKDSWRPKRTTSMDWRLAIAVLKQDLSTT